MRVLAVLATVAVWVASCGGSPSQPTPCTYDVSPSSLAIGPDGGSASLTVATAPGCAWSAAAGAAWITIVAGGSGSGGGTVTVSAAANAGEARTGTVNVAGQAIQVRQEAQACTVTLSPASRSVGAVGATGTFDVATPSHCGWTAASVAAWLVVTSGAQGQGTGQVAYQVSPNDDFTERTAAVTVGGQPFTVTQAGRTLCTPTLVPDDETFPAAGGEDTFSVIAADECGWTAASDVGWISVTAPAGGRGTGSLPVTYRADAHAGADERAGTIHVNGARFTVTQRGSGDCTYSVDPVLVSLCMYDTMFSPGIGITTRPGCGWTAASASAWLAVTSAAAGSGSATLSFRADENLGGRRQGTIQIRWPTPTAGQNVVVDQGGCTYAIVPATAAIPAAGGAGSFQVYPMADPVVCGGPLQDRCRWTAATTAGWISIVNPSGRGDAAVQFTVAPNTTGVPRTGTITLADKVFTVMQAAS